MKSLNELEKTLRQRRAKTRMLRRFMTRSSVATVLRDQAGELQVLLIKRAQREGDRWSGHIAFPGGREQQEDANIRETAIRETSEEIGLGLSVDNYIGRMSDVMTLAHGTRKPMVVSPYAFRLDGDPRFTINHEVDKVMWLPVSFLADKRNRETMVWKQKGMSVKLPCYHYEDHRIWGLTLKMLDELVFDILQ
ncbi:NUDIX hydrolase [Alkalimarinus alittae]|uniref:CoA pyrophosphatase n=1 Tax=Alkalimarinus alittae TaxID=2961619 RepID=A0ABY6N1H5_9ALTE|nr:CoA pyrophosphatase [Alkalimarinus alittae]UZE95963.1 CoA pyrophosphatase [Alkalimarinus alittae]